MMAPRPPGPGCDLLLVATACLGLVLVQVGWALVVPPFRGLDEHDHAYKAAAVARGDWSPAHESSPDGWGERMVVPRDLVVAARPICEDLPYTTPDNCTPGRAFNDDLVNVASSASRYNPIFYFVIGTPARAFSGADSLYAMRAVAMLGCTFLIGLALTVTRRWAHSAWPSAAILIAGTPMMLYSTSIAAPNGIEVAGALLVWSALLGLVRAPGARDWYFGVMATIGAVPLVTVRSLGPLWLILILLTVSMLLTRPRLARLVRDRAMLTCGAVVLSSAVAALAWTLVAGTNAPEVADGQHGSPTWSTLLAIWVLWFFQAIGAFPARDELAPLVLYAIALPVWWVICSIAIRLGTSKDRIVLGGIVLLSTAVALSVTVLTYDQLGSAWQGRYGYPYAMGFIMICGHVLDRASTSRSLGTWPIWIASVVFLATQLIGQLGVLENQGVDSPLAGTDAWVQPTPLVVVALATIGTLLLAWSLASSRRPRVDSLRT